MIADSHVRDEKRMMETVLLHKSTALPSLLYYWKGGELLLEQARHQDLINVVLFGDNAVLLHHIREEMPIFDSLLQRIHEDVVDNSRQRKAAGQLGTVTERIAFLGALAARLHALHRPRGTSELAQHVRQALQDVVQQLEEQSVRDRIGEVPLSRAKVALMMLDSEDAKLVILNHYGRLHFENVAEAIRSDDRKIEHPLTGLKLNIKQTVCCLRRWTRFAKGFPKCRRSSGKGSCGK